MTTELLDRSYCPFCNEPVQLTGPDYIETCPSHGVLEGISDEEWGEVVGYSDKEANDGDEEDCIERLLAGFVK